MQRIESNEQRRAAWLVKLWKRTEFLCGWGHRYLQMRGNSLGEMGSHRISPFAFVRPKSKACGVGSMGSVRLRTAWSKLLRNEQCLRSLYRINLTASSSSSTIMTTDDSYAARAHEFGMATADEIRQAYARPETIVLDVRGPAEIDVAIDRAVQTTCTADGCDELAADPTQFVPDRSATVIIYCKSGRRTYLLRVAFALILGNFAITDPHYVFHVTCNNKRCR
jgi:rhodanese-related sulfurtransferase